MTTVSVIRWVWLASVSVVLLACAEGQPRPTTEAMEAAGTRGGVRPGTRAARIVPPSGRGYDFDRGQAMARTDIRDGRLVYFVSGADARRLVALSEQVETRCGFSLRLGYAGDTPEPREIQFMQGYNGVTVPVIEDKLGATISELLERCSKPQGAGE